MKFLMNYLRHRLAARAADRHP